MGFPVDEESGISTAATNLASELSDTADIVLSASKEGPCDSPPAPASSCSSRFKGVVLQHNGHWGAQIYSDHRRLWLGTFKSEESAAAAYDRAAITFRPEDPYRNLEDRCRRPQLERLFHHLHPADTILGMIRDGSYDTKYSDYLVSGLGGGPPSAKKAFIGGGLELHQLFQKELTPSDVGKLNRLVIPKKHAVQHLPPVMAASSATEAKGDGCGGGGGGGGGGEVKGTMVEFRDREGRRWEFRYCYWSSSQSFVFTKGWNRFVKTKGLRARDTVVFYRCEEKGAACGGNGVTGGKPFEVIDVLEYNGGGDNNGSGTIVTSGGGVRVKEEEDDGEEEEVQGEVEEVTRDLDDNDGEDDEDNGDRSVVDKRQGVWLFGVQIAN